MSNVRLYLGHNNGDMPMDFNAQILPAIKDASKASGIDALTLTDGVGIWRGELESSTIIEMFNVDYWSAHAMAAMLASSLNQECVGMFSDSLGFELVSGSNAA